MEWGDEEDRWVDVTAASKVGAEARPFMVDGKRIVLMRSSRRIVAFPDRCPHAAARLSTGKVEAGGIVCPRHGWRFRLSDGHCAEHPIYTLQLWPCREVDGRVQVQPPPAEIW